MQRIPCLAFHGGDGDSNSPGGTNLSPPAQHQKGNEVTRGVTGLLTTDEVAKRDGVARKTVVERCNNGYYRGARQVQQGARLVWKIPEDYSQAETLPYDQLEAGWLKALKTGTLTGRPMAPTTLSNLTYGLAKYWETLGRKKAPQNVSPDHLNEAMGNIAVDYEGANCHYAQREAMYKAVKSFDRYLSRCGYHAPRDYEYTLVKPSRIMPERRKFTDEVGFNKLLTANKAKVNGRSARDVALTRVILYLAGLCGLRCGEITRLKLSDCDIDRQVMTIALGKGHKRRRVGMPQPLIDAIKMWMPYQKGQALLTVKTGQPVDRYAISKRIKWCSDRAGVDINPHGLRRTAAIIWLDRGYNIIKVQKMLGHTDVKITQAYALASEDDVIAMMAGK